MSHEARWVVLGFWLVHDWLMRYTIFCMTYRKRYEDSYLDEEDEEFDGNGKTDGERLEILIRKDDRTEKEDAFIKKLTERLFTGARLPPPPGTLAIEGLKGAARAYGERGDAQSALELWGRLAELGAQIGNRELYYAATEEIAIEGEES